MCGGGGTWPPAPFPSPMMISSYTIATDQGAKHIKLSPSFQGRNQAIRVLHISENSKSDSGRYKANQPLLIANWLPEDVYDLSQIRTNFDPVYNLTLASLVQNNQGHQYGTHLHSA